MNYVIHSGDERRRIEQRRLDLGECWSETWDSPETSGRFFYLEPGRCVQQLEALVGQRSAPFSGLSWWAVFFLFFSFFASGTVGCCSVPQWATPSGARVGLAPPSREGDFGQSQGPMNSAMRYIGPAGGRAPPQLFSLSRCTKIDGGLV